MARTQVRTDLNIKWVTSDLHFGHNNMFVGSSNWEDKSGCRPFANADDWFEQYREYHNSVVGYDDYVLHCGDFTFKHQHLLHYINQLNGRWINLRGNHDIDPNHPNSRPNVINDFYGAFNLYVDTLLFKVQGQVIHASHYPMLNWQWKAKDCVHLFGHIHGAQYRYSEAKGYYNPILPNSLDCSYDSTGQFVIPIEEAIERAYLNN